MGRGGLLDRQGGLLREDWVSAEGMGIKTREVEVVTLGLD